MEAAAAAGFYVQCLLGDVRRRRVKTLLLRLLACFSRHDLHPSPRADSCCSHDCNQCVWMCACLLLACLSVISLARAAAAALCATGHSLPVYAQPRRGGFDWRMFSCRFDSGCHSSVDKFCQFDTASCIRCCVEHVILCYIDHAIRLHCIQFPLTPGIHL